MAYTNPILQAVLGNQQQERANKQFEASLGLQIAQFAENKANTTKDQDYRNSVLGEQKRATGVIETANASAVELAAKIRKEEEPQRKATLGLTTAQAGAQDASAAYTRAQTTDVARAAQKKLLATNWGQMNANLVDDDGNDIPLMGNPEAQRHFKILMNSPGVNKTLEGKNGEKYEFVGIVEAGENRSVVQIRDPENPEKTLYMSRDRTAVEGDPITAMDMMGITAFRQQVSIAVRQAADQSLPKELRLASIAYNTIQGIPPGTDVELNGNTLQNSQNMAEKVKNNDFTPLPPLVSNSTDTAPPEDQKVDVADPFANKDLSAYSSDELNSLTDSQWSSALDASQRRLDSNMQKTPNNPIMVKRNNEMIAAVQKEIDKVDGEVPDSLAGQMQLLKNNAKRLNGIKAAGNDTMDAAQTAHNNLLDAKEVADGKKPAPAAIDKAAANIVKKAEINPRQSKKPELLAAVEKNIAANPPPVAQVAKALSKPGKVTPGLLFQLLAAKDLGLFGDDDQAISRAIDTGMFSSNGVDVIKKEMEMRNKTLIEAMKNGAAAAKPIIKTNGAGQVVALGANGQELWRTPIGDPRSTADQTAIIAQHSNQNGDGLDIEESLDLLGRQFTLSTKNTPMPELEQNLLAQNLQSYLVEELEISGLGSFYDWVRGSDEDGVHNPMERVTTNFAYDPKTKEIWLFDQYGERHADQDFYLKNIKSDAVKLLMTEGKILDTPDAVALKIKVEKLRRVNEEIAELTKKD